MILPAALLRHKEIQQVKDSPNDHEVVYSPRLGFLEGAQVLYRGAGGIVSRQG